MSGHDLLGSYTTAVRIDLVRKVTSSGCPRLDNWSNLNIYIYIFNLKTDEAKREQKMLIGVQH